LNSGKKFQQGGGIDDDHEPALGFPDALYRENNFSIAATEPGLLERMFHKHWLQSTSFGFGLVVLMQGRLLTFM
jgi:hypothetical protein